MNNFSRKINYGNQVLNASFMKIHAPVEKFFVVFETDQEEVASFDMVKEFSRWVVIHPAPDWVIVMQNQLSAIINGASPE